MFLRQLTKITVCVFTAAVLAGVAACSNSDTAVGLARRGKVDPLAKAGNEDQWRAFHQEAATNYGFTEDQARVADAVLLSCLTRATDSRGQYEANLAKAKQSKDAAAEQKARKDLETALGKLNDECLGRIEAVASLEQLKKAEAAGYLSPSRKNPKPRPEVGFMAPPFELKGPDGKAVTLEGLRGKVVVVQFWATWCGFCKKAAPEIQKLHEAVKDKTDVVIYAVNCRQRPNHPDPPTFLKEMGCTYNVLLNGDDVAAAYAVQGYPTMYVIGRDGKIVHKERGAQADLATRLVPIIEKALAEPPPPKGA